ncbi:MAG: DUF885 domain-containing protein [Gammaproteobacteria bacterium]|nr:DUF885 domain-containing protein [Gammaproteobacteria bacterium]
MALVPPAGTAEPAWVTRSNANALLLLEVTARYEPETASQIGIDGYDEAITDLSRDLFDAANADTRRVIGEYRRRLAAEADPRVRQDLDILIGAAQDALASNALQRRYFIPFFDINALIFGAVRTMLDARIPPARQTSVRVRLARYAGVSGGFRPIVELARERTRERMQADPHLLGPYRGEVQQALDDAPTLRAGIHDLLARSSLRGWQRDWKALERQLSHYDEWVRSEILPRTRPDHRLPAEVYADRLHRVGVDIPPQEIMARALTAFAEIRNQMNITASQIAQQQGLGDADYRAVLRHLKAQQIPADRVMPLYRERLAHIEAIVRAQRIVTLPGRAASIRLATPAENAQQPAPHMNPPRLIGNTGEYGEFVLTTGMPPDASGRSLAFDDFSHQAAAWTLTAHEARPGHELQFAKMIEVGVSTARAVFAFNSVNVEGWALYAEAELQPYEPLDGQLCALQMRALRAARAFLDPMVNLGQLSPQDARSFLMDEVVLSEGMATQEMQRYAFRAPGQATAYFYGYQRLMQIRQLAQLALRERFDRLAFNDFVLDQGLLPPGLLERAVLEEFVKAPAASGGLAPAGSR